MSGDILMILRYWLAKIFSEKNFALLVYYGKEILNTVWRNFIFVPFIVIGVIVVWGLIKGYLKGFRSVKPISMGSSVVSSAKKYFIDKWKNPDGSWSGKIVDERGESKMTIGGFKSEDELVEKAREIKEHL